LSIKNIKKISKKKKKKKKKKKEKKKKNKKKKKSIRILMDPSFIEIIKFISQKTQKLILNSLN